MSAIEDAIDRINHQEGVEGFFVVDNNGILLRCKKLETEYAKELAGELRSVVKLAQHTVRDIDPTNDLQFLRLRTRDIEVMAAPGPGFVAVVLQRWTPAGDAEEK